jgi:hypothetical protein
MTGNTAARLASPASSAPLSAGAPSSLPSARAPLIVPVDSPPAAPLPSASSLPPQEPVAMKRAARLMTSPRPSPAPPAPSLAAPWPAASPPVFAETAANGGATKRGSGERGNATPAEKATGEAGFTSPPPRGSESPERVLTRGQAAFDRGNYAEAIRRGKEAIAGGAAVPGHLLIGDAYYHLQRYADALREYQATLALEPSNALARRGRELAERAAAVTR